MAIKLEKQSTIPKIQSIDEIDDFHRLLLIDMSYSRIDTYAYCPAKYFYSYILKEDRQFAPYAALGNIVHEVLEIHAGEGSTHADMLVDFEAAKLKYDPDGLIWEDLLRTGETIIEHYVSSYAKSDQKVNILGKELPFDFVIGNAFVRGYIDRVDHLSKTQLRCIDWKTGKVAVTQKKVQDNLQLGTYALALFHKYPDVQYIKAELHYLKFEKVVGHTFTRNDIPRLSIMLAGRISEIFNDHFFHYTKNERGCGWCDHAVTGACAVGARRIKKKQGRY